MSLDIYQYAGQELGLFAEAQHWKSYLRRIVSPFIAGRVLEVGSGIGSTTKALCTGRELEWVCLEPDPRLALHAEQMVRDGSLPPICTVSVGTIRSSGVPGRFDAILYVDVLEHIEDDRSEIAAAAERLAPGGRLVVVAPAHQYLYSAFDRSIGHYRRYSLSALKSLAPSGTEYAWGGYLDCAGILASLAGKYLVPSGTPSKAAIAFWDRVLVPISQRADRAVRYQLGKTVVVIWKKRV
jgi:SAM-dependent methyltransferase